MGNWWICVSEIGMTIDRYTLDWPRHVFVSDVENNKRAAYGLKMYVMTVRRENMMLASTRYN